MSNTRIVDIDADKLETDDIVRLGAAHHVVLAVHPAFDPEKAVSGAPGVVVICRPALGGGRRRCWYFANTIKAQLVLGAAPAEPVSEESDVL